MGGMICGWCDRPVAYYGAAIMLVEIGHAPCVREWRAAVTRRSFMASSIFSAITVSGTANFPGDAEQLQGWLAERDRQRAVVVRFWGEIEWEIGRA